MTGALRVWPRQRLPDLLTVVEPATEGVLAEIPRAGAAEVDEAVARARRALPAWRKLAPGARAPRLRAPAGAPQGAVAPAPARGGPCPRGGSSRPERGRSVCASWQTFSRTTSRSWR